MAIPFDAVGFSWAHGDRFQELINLALEQAVADGALVEHASGATAIYRDPSGALLVLHATARNELAWANPSFESDLRLRWRPRTVVPDEDSEFCDVVYSERLAPGDEMIYPFAMIVESIGTDRELIPYGEPGDVRVVGLCQSGKVWPDEPAFHSSGEAHISDGPPRLAYAAQSFIPTGTFGKGTITPQALAHGIVEQVEERQNALTGERFYVARLDTSGGPIDTSWAAGDGAALAPGAVARANLWLIGSPLTLRDEPGPVPVHAED